MTTILRARVIRAAPGAWFAHARATPTTGRPDEPSILRSSSMLASHPEAMQAAYKIIADLDRELTDEVHASRATRRKATT